MDTNKQLLTVDNLFRMQGRQPGWSPSDMEYEQAVKTVEALNKEKLSSMMQPTPTTAVSGGSFTNAEGRVTDYIVKPKGVDVQILEPRVQNTQQGMFTMTSPTNAVPLVDPRTGQQLQGYAADPTMGGAPMPGIGGAGMAVTNSPAAAPTQTPAPPPTPQQLREGSVVRQNGVTYKIVNGQPVVVP